MAMRMSQEDMNGIYILLKKEKGRGKNRQCAAKESLHH